MTAVGMSGSRLAGARSYGDRYLAVLCGALLCYALLGRGFAYLGIPPVFVSEVLLAAGLLAALRSNCLFLAVANLPSLLLIALMGWVALCTAPFIRPYGVDALRDAVLVFYGLFAFAVAGLLIEKPTRLLSLITRYGKFARLFVFAMPVLFTAYRLYGEWLPVWPNSGVTVVTLRGSEASVHFAGALLFAIAGFRRFSLLWATMLVLGFVTVSAASRGGMVAFLLPVALAAALLPRNRHLWRITLVAVALAIVAVGFDLSINFVGQARGVSAEQVATNLISVFRPTGNVDLDGTRRWREQWWSDILDYTWHGRYFWTGKGFGPNLANADGYQVVSDDLPPLRSPHNSHLTMLARGGVPAAALWGAACLSWLILMIRRCWQSHVRGNRAWSRLFFFLIFYWLAFLINAAFDVALEGPMLGIWFWVLYGVGLGAAAIHAAEQAQESKEPRFATRIPSRGTVGRPITGAGMLLLPVLLTLASTCRETGAATRGEAPAEVVVEPGRSLQEAIDAHLPGTTFLVKAGVHRLQDVVPKDGDTFIGEPGAILSGAEALTSFRKEGQDYVAPGPRQLGQVHGACLPGRRCDRPEDLFIDDRWLQHVTSRDALGPGRYYVDAERAEVRLRDDPTGKRVEIATARRAFAGTASQVTIRHLVIEKYAIPAQMGAIGDQSPGRGWTIENCEIRLNHGAGVKLGDSSRVVASFIHHNGQEGVTSAGATALVITDSEIAYNNQAGFDPDWEAGGVKITASHQAVIRNNYVHHNRGPGLWTDIDNVQTLYEGNRVESNDRAGIQHEISFSAVIRNNRVADNGKAFHPWGWGAQILIQNSKGVEVYRNAVSPGSTDGNGIALIEQDRGTGSHGPYVVRDCYVHDNDVWLERDAGLMSAALSDYPSSRLTEGGNRFDANTYHVRNMRGHFWAWSTAKRLSFAEFRSVSGQESAGRLVPE